MQVHTDIKHLPSFRKAVLTIGTFDGVHQGHHQILTQVVSEADRIDGESVIITFDPHPRDIIGKPGQHIPLLNTLSEKITLLAEAGIDHLVIVPFTAEFGSMDADNYVKEFLIRSFNPHTIIIGYDHKFGSQRKGDFSLLENYSTKGQFQLKEIPGHIINESSVSSTRIRQALQQGQMQEANMLLGYPYFFHGVVVEGNKLGRTIGFPTANLHIENPNKLIPGNGVYVVKLMIPEEGNTVYEGMMNIGIRPTIGGNQRMIEVHIFEFDRDIYGKTLQVEILQQLRLEKKFDGLEHLKEQLAIDSLNARKLLGENREESA